MAGTRRRHVWQPLRIRKRLLPDGTFTEETHLHEDWLELFTDLLCVAMFMKLSRILAVEGPHCAVFFQCFVSFILVWHVSAFMTLYINRFISDSLVRLILLCSVSFGIFLMVLNVNHASTDWESCYITGFNYGFAVSRLAMAFLLAEAAFTFPENGPAGKILAASLLISTGWIWLSSFIVHRVKDKLFASAYYFVAFAIEVAGFLSNPSLCPRQGCWSLARPTLKVGVNISHWDARVSIMVMVTLGEGIIQTLDEPPPPKALWWRYAYSSGGFALLLVLALLYFDAKPHRIDGHVLRKSMLRSIVMKYTMPVLYFSLFLIGTSFEILLHLGQTAALQDDCMSVSAGHGHGHGHGPVPGQHAVARALSEGHWGLEAACKLLSLSVACSILAMTFCQHLHEGVAGIHSWEHISILVLQLLLVLAHACMYRCSMSVASCTSDIALVEVWGHVLLKVPLTVTQLRCNPFSHHPEDEDGVLKGHVAQPEEEVEARQTRARSSSLAGMSVLSNVGSPEFTEDSWLYRTTSEPESAGLTRQRHSSTAAMTPVGEDGVELSARS